MMHPNEELLTRFYTCFQQKDAAGMAACYHPDAEFTDPIFQTLKRERAVAMWQMLLGRSKDIEIIFSDVQADEQQGKAHWDAYYTYSATGRKVHNIVDAQFRLQDGLILIHKDTFDLAKWAAQALGVTGRLLGWTPFMQQTIRRNAAKTLDAYIAGKKAKNT
ncbi:MAG: nuclear transport factor 2 family protein [Ktedonobacteraceae bacterium]|nr:nuclear transport factor 2 family protein [Ktedonobacteraceae bacterium]